MRNKRFEEWFATRNELTPEQVADMWKGDEYRSYKFHVELAWAAWLASAGFINTKVPG
jgi:hypothetical protein